MIIQNAYQTPDGTILYSNNSQNQEYFDKKVSKKFFICGGRQSLINNITDECIPYFLTEDNSIKDFKENLLWRTYEAQSWEERKEYKFTRLCSLSTDHLTSILMMSSASLLVKYIAGEIIHDRKNIIRLKNATPNP